MERKTYNHKPLLNGALAIVLSACMSKSQPIVGRDMVSPVIRSYGEAVMKDSLAERSGLTPEEIEAREKCLSGFSCTDWENLNTR